jgi:hypothetical protein
VSEDKTGKRKSKYSVETERTLKPDSEVKELTNKKRKLDNLKPKRSEAGSQVKLTKGKKQGSSSRNGKEGTLTSGSRGGVEKASKKVKDGGKAKNKKEPGLIATTRTKNGVNLTMDQRLKLRPDGCATCRKRSGCTASCWSKRNVVL